MSLHTAHIRGDKPTKGIGNSNTVGKKKPCIYCTYKQKKIYIYIEREICSIVERERERKRERNELLKIQVRQSPHEVFGP